MAIIASATDTDLYKLTMQQCVWHQFANIPVAYRFYCRNHIDLSFCCKRINEELDAFCDLQFSEAEIAYLATLPYFKKAYLDYLRQFRFQRDAIHAYVKDGQCQIDIKGSWADTILFETPVLAIVNECYYQHIYSDPSYTIGRENLLAKLALITSDKEYEQFHFSDFGTRRRFNRPWQKEVLRTCIEKCPNHLIGTSNVSLAMEYGLTPNGTMAHEYLQACQALAPSLRESQQFALKHWLSEYPNQLGIALTDVINIHAFLRDFSCDFAQRYQGLRQDSGDPIAWTEKVLAHYEQCHIDPKEKTLVYSDGLTFPHALDIYQRFHDKAKLIFGIGTNLLNDLGYPQLHIVIKMISANGQPVAKISDSPGKAIKEHRDYIEKLKTTFAV